MIRSLRNRRRGAAGAAVRCGGRETLYDLMKPKLVEPGCLIPVASLKLYFAFEDVEKAACLNFKRSSIGWLASEFTEPSDCVIAFATHKSLV